jgi:hypothetical protein
MLVLHKDNTSLWEPVRFPVVEALASADNFVITAGWGPFDESRYAANRGSLTQRERVKYGCNKAYFVLGKGYWRGQTG